MTTGAVEQAIDEGRIRQDDPLQIGEELFIKLNRVPYLFNHSCLPNAGIDKKRALIALRDIAKGEEITYDYATTVCTHSSWRMQCRCGASVCRKIIKNVSSIPKRVRDFYQKEGVLPAFVAREVT